MNIFLIIISKVPRDFNHPKNKLYLGTFAQWMPENGWCVLQLNCFLVTKGDTIEPLGRHIDFIEC